MGGKPPINKTKLVYCVLESLTSCECGVLGSRNNDFFACLGISALSGVFVVGIVFFMAKALQAGAAGVVLSIAQMSFLGTLFLSVVFLKEKLEVFKVSGIVCGVAAILLLALK